MQKAFLKIIAVNLLCLSLTDLKTMTRNALLFYAKNHSAYSSNIVEFPISRKTQTLFLNTLNHFIV